MSIRRCRDATVAALALCVLAPVMALVAVLVLAADGRPVLFRQIRSGLNGVPFRVSKFRTMTQHRDGTGRLLPDADRTTWLGRMLRRLRLDELPQLGNVLLGTMSLVGPRPLLPETIAMAGETGRRRGLVRPGLTGWAQIHGNALLSTGDKLALDCWYVTHRSHALDLHILWCTVRVLILGERVDAAAIGRAYASDPRRRG